MVIVSAKEIDFVLLNFLSKNEYQNYITIQDNAWLYAQKFWA